VKAKLMVAIILLVLLSGSALSSSKATDFSFSDINSGKEYRISDFHGKIVLIDFMSYSCTACDELQRNLEKIWPDYRDKVQFISIDVGPMDTEEQLREKGIPWIAGLNSSIVLDYKISGTPKVVILDKEGYIVKERDGVMDVNELRSVLEEVISGKAHRIDIQKVSIYTLALFAGIASFFSPCSFPMLPGYMAYYFGIGKKETGYRKALVGGSAAAMGIIAIYLFIGALLLYSASFIAPYIPMIGLVVGILLIILGLLMLTPLQYDALLKPFRPIGDAFRKMSKGREYGFSAKLFGYGIAYGGAAAGCTAPVFLAVIIAAMATSLMTGITALLIYSLSAGLLMIAVTLMMAAVETKAIDFLKRNTERIKIGSAIILILVGVFLILQHAVA
jgi:cytochrome c-type biogenesis protein